MSAVSLGGWKRGSDSLEQAVQGAASHGMQVLGIGPGFFARAVHALPSHLLRLLAWGNSLAVSKPVVSHNVKVLCGPLLASY